MKKLLLATLLLGCAMPGFSQFENERPVQKAPTPTERNFSIPKGNVNIRDYACLPNKGKMIIELVNAKQYEDLRTLPSTINKLLQELSFYKDSLETGSGSVRIDYAVDEEYPFRKLRIVKHPSDGNTFVTNTQEVSRLKLDQDTVCFYIRRYPLMEPWKAKRRRQQWNYPMYASRFYQITFCINNYTDLAKIAADSATLFHAFDTLYSTKRESTLANPYYNPSSSRYNPYSRNTGHLKPRLASPLDVRFKQYGGLVLSDNARNWDVISRTDVLTMDINMGAGLVRNYLAPYAEAGLSLVRNSRRPYNDQYYHYKYALSVSSYFMFEKNATGKFDMHPNSFVNFYVGEGKELSFGAGYLFWNSGNYFNGTTAKVFMNVKMLKKGLTLSPEIILTNNLKQVFPGLTLKVF